uniref:Pectinesterase n=1 Tax=Linum usitatissimum TaxID=4006 RepID=Q9FVF9_LINUS|nr:putative pectin methylesterase 3 [Linum usitatissimum]
MATSAYFLTLLNLLIIILASSTSTFVASTRTYSSLSASRCAILTSSCSNTRHPDLCFSSLASAPVHVSLNTQMDVIKASINVTCTSVLRNIAAVNKALSTRTDLTPRSRSALKDCVETMSTSLDELHVALAELDEYPNKKSITRHADDLKTLLSAATTNQETCLDGFSHDDSEKKVRKTLETGPVRVEKMCGNALGMIVNMTETDMASATNAVNTEGGSSGSWPIWMKGGDRRLLQAGTTVTPNVVVAADGSGKYRRVSEAVAAAPSKSSKRYVIRIKAGIYRENVEVPKDKTNIMFVGDGRSNTIITGNKNVVDGSTTFNSATVAVVGQGFLARDITFQNTAGPSKHQAVALRVGADLAAFYRCDFLAYQDTLYVHSNRQFFINCLVVGTVDFIFGNSAAVFQNCDIHARRPNPGQKNMLTAHGRTDPNQNTGIVIQKSRIAATSDLQSVKGSFGTYLGRPWKAYARTVIMQSTISDVVHPAGWHEWDGNFALNTLFYGEHKNSGAGSGVNGRVKWKGHKVISSDAEAAGFTPGRFIAGGSWLGSTTFPFTLGL